MIIGADEKESLKKILKGLKKFTERARPTMHEAYSEIGLKGKVYGDCIDNAMGVHVVKDPSYRGNQDMVLVLTKDDEGEKAKFAINVANLIALARFAVVPD